ncbi:MAG TPA: alpha/beta hydrolase [Acidimicrobiia bacterium]|nr:alpha/beta hydrolase [Acidimicrobiia bacterium]
MTYLLIHGGGSTARFWDRLLPYIDAPHLAVDLPGRNGKPADFGTLTVDEEVASVLADVQHADPADPLVIVAHSSGGLVVPGVVAALSERVAHVVLSAALVPAEGGFGLDCIKARQREGLVASVEQARRDGTVITLPGAPGDPEPFRHAYGGDPLDDDTLAFIVDPVRCVPDTVNHYFQPIHWSRAAAVPVTYLLNTRDRPIPSATQEQMITHLPNAPRVVRIDSGHIPAVTAPAAFAKLLASVH